MDFPATIGNTIDLLASPEARRKAKIDIKIRLFWERQPRNGVAPPERLWRRF